MNTEEREALILEAAKAILNELGGITPEELEPMHESAARAAFAVFEKGHGPNGDEREAIIDALLDELGWEWDEVPEEHIASSREILGDMADRAIAVSAGFRVTERRPDGSAS